MKTVQNISIILISFIVVLQSDFVFGIQMDKRTTVRDEIKEIQTSNLPKHEKTSDKDLRDLVESEKAFAATAIKEGFRDSFIKFFDDDGIGFGPHPEKTKEKLQKTPLETGPRMLSFNWQPMFGDISLAGDLGYTTGPLLFTDLSPKNPRPPAHGAYFSVWQKQASGDWKVVVDMGIATPEQIAPINVGFTPADNQKGIDKKSIKKFSAGDFSNLDQDFSTDVEKFGAVEAYKRRLGNQFRIHRNGLKPILTEKALADFYGGKPVKILFKMLGGKMAKSKDLSYTYGSFYMTSSASGSEDVQKTGYYVHVWRRQKSGEWKLVADINNELPKKQEPIN